jgi:preflagellin peptidase FlaK
VLDWLGTLLTESPPADLLRLTAVPVFGWAAYRDVRTRRVPNRTWLPLVAIGVAALVWEAWRVSTGDAAGVFDDLDREWYFLRVALSLGMVGSLGYLFYWFGGFGGADAKAIIVLAVLFPTFPAYELGGTPLPLTDTVVGVFSLTILSNTVLAGAIYPLAIAARNALTGHVGKAMLIGKPVAVADVPETYGSLLQTPDGFTRSGLDLDALRMYLQWRGCTLADLRADPERYRDPASLPTDPNPPGDGSIPTDAAAESGSDSDTETVTDGGIDATDDGRGDTTVEDESDEAADAGSAGHDDPWGAAAFFEDIEGDAYATTPEELRDGLDVLASEDVVWVTPGLPFIVPMFAGLLVSLVYGDVLIELFSLVA